MPKPRLFLHIGHPKTGTTGIQTFLLTNRERFLEAGLLYPQTGVEDSAHRLLSPSFYSLRFRENRSPAVWSALAREIRKSSLPVIVLSCEAFWFDHPRTFAPLLELAEVTVVAYLRRQDHLAESRHAQRIRSYMNMDLRRPDLAGYAEEPLTDFHRDLSRFASLVGKDHMLVRPFEPGSLCQNDPALDFMQTIGFALPPGLTGTTSSNASLKRPYLAFKRHCNALPLLEAEHRRLGRNLNQLSQGDPAPSPGPLLPFDQRLRIFERHQDSNAAVARDFLNRPGGGLFTEPPPDPASPWEPLLPLSPEAQRTVFDALSPENQACLESLWKPARLALPGEALLPPLPDDQPDALERLLNQRIADQCRRRLAVLEQAFPGASAQSGDACL